MDLSRALEVALEAAREAGELLRRDFHRSTGPRGTGDKAEADVEAEILIRERLLEAFPGWTYLGEETGREPGASGSPVWLVDPNDGTRDYLKGRRGSAVSIGLVGDHRPVLGVVYAFAYPDGRGDTFAWAEGCGPLRRNGRAVSGSLPSSLTAADMVLVSSHGDRDPEGNLGCAAPARYRAVPSIAHRLALLATGEAAGVASLFAPVAWDYGAGHALLRAAGGVLVNEDGREVAYGDDGSSGTLRAYAGSPAVAAELARRPWEKVGRLKVPSRDWPARLRAGEAVADPVLLSRAQGCLLGQVGGDSLGALVELAPASDVAKRYPEGPRRLVDGGACHTLAGQPTAASEMALALARSILAFGSYDVADALEAYRRWHRSHPFAVGAATRAALRGRPDPASQGSGSLTRVSPLGLFGQRLRPPEAAELARRDSALTHPNAICCDAAGALAVAIAHALRSTDGPEPVYRAALVWAREAEVAGPVIEALLGAAESPPECDGPGRGSALTALRNAFFELLHGPSLEEGVVATVRRGGHAAANAAVAGALLGAVHGREAVPDQWRGMVLSCRAHPLCAHHPRPQDYWPVDVMEISERLVLAGEAARR